MPAQLHRKFAHKWYTRVPSDPSPEVLAERLAEAQVASAAAKRIDTYERFHHQHSEHHKALVRGILGATGLILSIGPSVPALHASCRQHQDWECGLRTLAMSGGIIALSVTAWAFWDLYHQPSRLALHVAKLNDEMDRAMQSRTGEAKVTRLFDLYRSMSRDEQTALKAYLHERARQPRDGVAAPAAGEDTTVNIDSDDDVGSSSALAEVGSDELPALEPPPGSPRAWHGVTLKRPR